MYGDYVLNTTATNVLPTSVNFTKTTQDSSKYGLYITPLIVDKGNTMQDIALISIINSAGSTVDTNYAFGHPIKVTITGSDIDDTVVTITGDSAKFHASLDTNTSITATAPGLTWATVEILLPRIASRIDLEIPNNVHLHEEFPFAMHEIDSIGTLLGTSQNVDLVASGVSVDWESHRMTPNLTGKITMSVLADYGAYQKTLDVFANDLDVDIRVSGATARVGTPFRIDVLALDDITIGVSTGMHWNLVEGFTSIDVTSDVSGEFPVTITASKHGYGPESKTIYVTVEDYVQLDVSAIGSDGLTLELVDVSLGLNTRNSEETRSSIVLPWKREYKDLASAQITFPHSYTTDNGYIFSSVTVNGREYD